MVDEIKKLCKDRNISIRKLEIQAGFGNGTIARWDKNKPSYDKIQIIADILQVSPDCITDSESSEHTIPPEIADLLQQLDKAPETIKKAAIAAAKAVLKTGD